MNPRAIAIVMACNVVWALNVVVSKLAVDDLGVPPLFYTTLRSALVVVVLLPWLVRPLPAQLGRVLAIGFAISGGAFALQFIGLQTATPSAAGIVNLSGAPLTVLFAVLFLGEEVRWRRGLGMVLALTGVVIAIGSPSGAQSGWGLGFIFGGALIGALGAVFVKRLALSAVALQAWAGLVSLVVLAPMSLTLESGQVEALAAAPWKVAGCVVFAGLIVSVGAHSAYFNLFKQHDANLIVPLTLFTPLLTIAFGAWLTGDPIGWQLLGGGALALVGVAIIVIRPSRSLFKPLLVRPRL
jgi:O-acetylserine/cysteine efflux transporter